MDFTKSELPLHFQKVVQNNKDETSIFSNLKLVSLTNIKTNNTRIIPIVNELQNVLNDIIEIDQVNVKSELKGIQTIQCPMEGGVQENVIKELKALKCSPKPPSVPKPFVPTFLAKL
jgi:hypothetical protein